MRVPRDPMTEGPRPPVTPPVWTPPEGPGAPGTAPSSSGRVLPFRRRTGLPVRRRSRLAAFVRPFLMAVAIVGTPAAALWWSAVSPRFALTELEVRGSERVSDPWIRAQLAGLVGRNLVWMPLGAVETTLSGHPWVAGAEVTKELPDRLRVVVVERRPAALLEVGADPELVWIDAEGAVIAPVLPGAEAARTGGLLRVRWPAVDEAPAERRRQTLAAALGAANALESAASGWGGGTEIVEVLGEDEFRLEGEDLPFPLLLRFDPEAPQGRRGGADEEEIASRVRHLEELLPELVAAAGPVPPPASVDLRFRNRIVVRPAVVETPERQERGA